MDTHNTTQPGQEKDGHAINELVFLEMNITGVAWLTEEHAQQFLNELRHLGHRQGFTFLPEAEISRTKAPKDEGMNLTIEINQCWKQKGVRI